jgi:hypothetical protein
LLYLVVVEVVVVVGPELQTYWLQFVRAVFPFRTAVIGVVDVVDVVAVVVAALVGVVAPALVDAVPVAFAYAP